MVALLLRHGCKGRWWLVFFLPVHPAFCLFRRDEFQCSFEFVTFKDTSGIEFFGNKTTSDVVIEPIVGQDITTLFQRQPENWVVVVDVGRKT